jgi:DNA-binding transcriptional ArsR family regulator
MPKGVGKALEMAITTKEENRIYKKKNNKIKYEFMNRNRQKIFSYLCSHPCSYISMISRATGLSLHATNWHLRKLEDADYINKRVMGKKNVYYPIELIHIEDVPILEILNTQKAKVIYLTIVDKKGISQKEICGLLGLKHQAVIWYTKKLENLKLTTSLEDGKYRRYYPTELLSQKRDENVKRVKIFKNQIIKRFEKGMLSPTILRSTDRKLVVRITSGRNKAVITLFTDPFFTVLS